MRTQHRFGVPSEILDPEECIKMVPPLGRERLRGGSFCGLDGSASPFLWLDALLRACRRQGVEVVYGVRARSIEPVEARYRVHLDDGPVEAARSSSAPTGRRPSFSLRSASMCERSLFRRRSSSPRRPRLR